MKEAPDRTVEFARSAGGALRVRIAGSWSLATGIESIDRFQVELERDVAAGAVLEDAGIGDWDSTLPTYVAQLHSLCERHGAPLDIGSLPEGVRRLVGLATSATEREGSRRSTDEEPLLDQVGEQALASFGVAWDFLPFLGEIASALPRALVGRGRFRRSDFALALQQAGIAALPIVSLVVFLMGAVLAFIGAIQLTQFGATIYVANLVGVGTVRETGALMTGIVLTGRSGASFAAVLGSMTVSEEVDALETLGLSPVEFLALPRVLALALMTPLLVAYANVTGILGGLLVSVSVLDVTSTEYIVQTLDALDVNHLIVGLVKALVFGVAVALAGCYYGLRCRRSAAGVGEATTLAVVTGIVLVVICDAALTIVFHVLGI